MTVSERQLLQLLQQRSFQRGAFRLASGATSSYYIDGRTTAVFSEGAFLIGRVLYERTTDLGIDAIGGMEVGAVPLTAAAVIHYHLNGRRMEGFWVRDRAKAHGTRKLIEGAPLRPSSRIVVLDDVVTTGGSAIKAVEAIREVGCEVVQVLALVDRLQGAAGAFSELGVEFRSVFTIRDFGVDVPGDGGPTAH
jgi:orotate phosphoribosyltransferase